MLFSLTLSSYNLLCLIIKSLGYKVSPYKMDDVALKLKEQGNQKKLSGVFYEQDIKVLNKPKV